MRKDAVACDDWRINTTQLRRLLKKLGYETALGGSGHWQVFAPNGKRITTFPASPHGGDRSMQNTIADLRRAGVRIPRKGERC